MSLQVARRKVVFLRQFFQAFCLSSCLFWRDKRSVPMTMIALEVFVQGKFLTFRELLVYFEFRLAFTVRHVFFYLPPFATANHKRWIQICCETSCSFSGTTSSKTKICCRKYNSSLLCATYCLNLQHCILLRDKLVTNVVIRATMCFNLQCNNVARQVEEKCCPYCRTLNVVSVVQQLRSVYCKTERGQTANDLWDDARRRWTWYAKEKPDAIAKRQSHASGVVPN